jgi:hypothetical protein
MKSLQSILRKCSQTRMILIFLIFLFAIPQAFSSNIDTTTIVIVGTVHNKTEKFTHDSLFNIIKRVNPDLILMELDSSFFTIAMSIKPEFQKITLENSVVTKYQESHKVLIRPYDLEGRNKIYSDNNYFEQQQELSKALIQATQDDQIQGESKILLDAIFRFDQITHAFASDYPNVINSNSCIVAMDSKQYYANDGMVKIVASVPILNHFIRFTTFKRDFWLKRNEAMVNKILYWNKNFHSKTILVLCGFEHKAYISASLSNQNSNNNFKIKEYWSF